MRPSLNYFGYLLLHFVIVASDALLAVMRYSKHDSVLALRCSIATLLSTAAMISHVFPVPSDAYTTTLVQQFTVAEEQPAGTLIGRVVGVRPPLRVYFRAGSDAERDLTVDEEDGSIRARSVYSDNDIRHFCLCAMH